ncbi:MAG TPA: hypothetical protein VFS05_15755 [Gemmatimonadaceae bacterium]|nr:hypothetical protein [Gemmatimonadaceae bacterium]
MHLISISALLLALSAVPASAQWTPQPTGTTSSLRGIHAVSARVAWASGSGGTVLRTTDGGATWRADTIPGAGALDFRDIHALDADTAWVLSAGDGAASTIWKTADGGRTWRRTWANPGPGGFFDAIAFWDAQHGIAVGDPVGGRFQVVLTDDGGESWHPLPDDALPPALPGEAAFAASGTALVVHGAAEAWLGTGGGRVARVFRSIDRGRSWTAAETPVAAGGSSSGIFSLAFADARHGVAVGGDYAKPAEPGDVIARTDDGGRSWRLAGRAAPPGYKSAVVAVPGTAGRALVAVGLTGSGLSLDGGEHWTAVDGEAWHAASFAAPDAGWVVGPQGRIARWSGSALRAAARPRR